MSADSDHVISRPAELGELLNRAPCGFLSFGDDGVVRLANATLLDMLGAQEQDVAGRHVENIFTVGTRIFYQTHWFPLLRMHGRAEEIFLMLCTRSGEDVGVLVNAVKRAAGAEAAYDCVIMRVRERQKYEDELLRARRVAEQAQVELEVQKRGLEQANATLSAQTEELELQQQQLHDQTMDLEATQEELRAINDELLERTHDLEVARAAADEANQAKSAFLAVMSHELRTPLNAIAGYADLLELGVQGEVNEAQLESLKRIKRSQRHLLRLINDVLNLARIEAGRLDYAIEAIPMSLLVENVGQMVEPQMVAKQLSFTMEVDANTRVRADRDKAEQILLNLLSNAIKFTPSGGRVELRSEPGAEGTICIAVSDTGIGIPADQLESVFEPFVQVDVSTTGHAEGTGLGLAISRDLARGMGGDLSARSEEGRGSTFLLQLPRVA